MSQQRAIKFCRLCYQFENTAIAQDQVTDYRRLLARNYATSMAMQAVEQAFSGEGDENMMNELLTACQDCEYKSPKIADLLAAKKSV